MWGPLVLGAALLASVGCTAKVTPKSGAGTGGSTGGTGGSVGSTGQGGSAGATGTAGSTGTGGAGGIIVIGTDAGSDAACTPSVTTCTPAGGQYCGKIGNGCRGGSLECGACAGDGVCTAGLCIGGPSCARATCTSGGSARYCGTIGDACGGKLECGACPTGQVCTAGVCAPANCVPLTCASGTTRYCGTIGDGCGGTLPCGDCAAGSTCGGGGVPGVCTPTNCTPITCNPMGGGQYCGRIGNGCGGALDCPACPGGMACGTGAQAGVCPNVPGTGGCTGIQCNIATCTGTAKTTVTGTIYDPAGVTPLYNAVAYVPNAALDPIPTGASCDRCSVTLSGKPIAAALSDVNGRFTLENVPTGTNVPLVIQVGKWRRQVMIPRVTACVDNPITDANLTRLPRNKGEGNIPKIAVTTGGSDAFECLLRKIGVADAEYTLESGNGRINLFAGGDPAEPVNPSGGDGPGATQFNAALGGGRFPWATTLWGSTSKMLGYDLLIFSCEGSQFDKVKMPYLANVKAYADAGGRLFLDHLTYYFLRNGPAPFPSTASYISPGSGSAQPLNPSTAIINDAFPKGAALADWMVARGASTTRGQMQIYEPQQAAIAVAGATQSWISIPTNTRDPVTPQRPAIQYMTFNTPVEAAADAQCGRTVFTSIHLNAAPAPAGDNDDLSRPDTPFPDGCRGRTLSAQEKALEFLFFDLSACVQPDTMKPVPPTIPPPGIPNSPPPATTPPPAPPPPPPPPPPPMVD
jgi:hypothetical protein